MKGKATVFVMSLLFASCRQEPIESPSYNEGFAGIARKLPCLAELKMAGVAGFVAKMRAKSDRDRRVCADQLTWALRPEPDFAEHGAWLSYDAAQGIAGLDRAHAMELPSTLHPLIECLKHPSYQVSEFCETALISLTHHTYGKAYYEGYRGIVPTPEALERLVDDWSLWERQMNGRHPVFDHWLATQCQDALNAVRSGLIAGLPGSTAIGYLNHWAVPTDGHFYPGEALSNFAVGDYNADNWSSRDTLRHVAITILRPGIPEPRSIPQAELIWLSPNAIAGPSGRLEPGDPKDHVYREEFPALDLEVRVDVSTSDDGLRKRAYTSVRESLAGLRAANERSY